MLVNSVSKEGNRAQTAGEGFQTHLLALLSGGLETQLPIGSGPSLDTAFSTARSWDHQPSTVALSGFSYGCLALG